MIEWHPSIPFYLGALLCWVAPKRLRQVLQLAIPFASFWFLSRLMSLGPEQIDAVSFFGVPMNYFRADSLALLFVYAFLIFSFLANVYSLHVESPTISIFANLYVGSSVGAVLAGDLITLFIFWEMMAVTSAVLIYNPARPDSLKSMMRYLLVHVTGGLLFISGLLMKFLSSDALTFEAFTLDTAGVLILCAFLLNAAAPPRH